jgi:hypothetical protein
MLRKSDEAAKNLAILIVTALILGNASRKSADYKNKLRKLIERSKCSEILYAQHIERDGKLLFEEVVERNLEGMVAKRRMGVYAEHGWLKIKNPKYTQVEGRHDMFTAFKERGARVPR